MSDNQNSLDDESKTFYDQNSVLFAKAKAYQEVAIESVVKERDRWKFFSITSLFGMIGCIFISGAIVLDKEYVPLLIKYNETMGDVSVYTIDSQTIDESAKTALHKHWLAQYINCSETYDFNDQTRLYNCALTYASPRVASEYIKRFDSNNSANWFDRYGKNTVVKTEIISINELPERDSEIRKPDEEHKGVTRWLVKVNRIEKSNNGEIKPVQLSIYAETRFEKLSKNLTEVMSNPLNFKVIHYRDDYIANTK